MNKNLKLHQIVAKDLKPKEFVQNCWKKFKIVLNQTKRMNKNPKLWKSHKFIKKSEIVANHTIL